MQKINKKQQIKRMGWSQMLGGTLRGFGQVMFQSNIGCSLCFLAGIFWGAWAEGRMEVAWGGVVGLLSATLCGSLLRRDPKEGEQGLWGFNGALLGCATMTFLEPGPGVWAALILASAATLWLREGMNRLMAKGGINSLTMPFVLLTWMLLLAARNLQELPIEGLPSPTLPHALSPELNRGPIHLIFYWLRGISQVFLLNSWVAGLLFLVGLILSNGWSAFWGAVGSALALAAALWLGAPGANIEAGLYGFSPTLTGIAIGSIFYRPSWRSALWAVAAILLTVIAQAATDVLLSPIGLPSLTAPFCLVTWLFLAPMYNLNARRERESSFAPPTDHSGWSHEQKSHLRSLR